MRCRGGVGQLEVVEALPLFAAGGRKVPGH